MIIREAITDDAKTFVDLIKEVESNSDFMFMESGERQTTPEQQAKLIDRFDQQQNSNIFVAEENGRLVGYLIAIGGTVKRTTHSAQLVIGILREHRGKKIGTKLFDYAEQWALNNHISRLELTVVTENKAGLYLYQKSGFEIEGTKRNSLFIGGKYFDEYYMAKLL